MNRRAWMLRFIEANLGTLARARVDHMSDADLERIVASVARKRAVS